MEQLSAHLGNSAFVSILIEAPKHKKNQTISDCSILKNLHEENTICNSPSPTQSITPGVSRRTLGRLQPAVGQTCTVLAVTAQPPGQEESSKSRKIRQDEAGGRGVQGSRTGVVGFWERAVSPKLCGCDATKRHGEHCTSGSGDPGSGQTLPPALPGALAY